MSETEALAVISASRVDLESSDLALLLRQMTDRDIDGLASILTDMPKADVLNRCVTRVGREVFGLHGKALIPGIVHDLCWLASPTVGSTKSYREALQAVARRHEIKDDGLKPPSEIERALQAQYLTQLRPDPRQFTERTGPSRLATLAGRVSAAASPNARVLTAAVLEVAALRRIALMREFANSLEAA